ncbi:chromophore lyase, partial [Klebsiella pneumoniae]|nr:chromophore lyase [Klebsiella pneumoniae]
MRQIFGEMIYGGVIDDQTRCIHWNSPLDIIAIKFSC